MATGTRSEFAAQQGVNKSTVSRWEKKGRLVFTADGLVDFEASRQLIVSTADPAKQGVSKRHAQERAEKSLALDAGFDVGSGLPSAPKAPESSKSTQTYDAFNQARADKEAELAKLAKIKRLEQEGHLIRRDKVKADIEALASIVSKGLSGLTARIMPQLNGEADPGKREQILESEIRRVLSEFATAAVTLDADGELVGDA